MADVSQQWQKLTRDEFGSSAEEFLRSFRAPGTANKFVAWNPFERSTRYFKFLLFNAARSKGDRFFDAYRRIEGRDVGDPITIRCGGCEIDADYLAAVEEWEFLESYGALADARIVVEIGAGFGRTCHTLLTLCDKIERYVIIDLPPMLELSRSYLRRVIPNASVDFVASDDATAISALQPDLTINIDSFQEMPPHVIADYMTRVVRRSKTFYCKNPVGKYAPESVGMQGAEPERLMDVFSLGYCREVIDIFDDADLAEAQARYLDRYCPPPEGDAVFRLTASEPMELFPYFVHALYSR
jgi:putative sugar O-methyltransferase